jgi:transcriptional regulator with XRE-family HTH domain
LEADNSMTDKPVSMSPKRDDLQDFIKQKPKRQVNPLFAVVTPIFTKEIGARMKIARMQRLWDQDELGDQLGCSKKTISDLEMGKIGVTRKAFTLERFMDVFGKDTSFILLGTGADRFNAGFIGQRYWNLKHKPKPGDRRITSGIWAKK